MAKKEQVKKEPKVKLTPQEKKLIKVEQQQTTLIEQEVAAMLKKFKLVEVDFNNAKSVEKYYKEIFPLVQEGKAKVNHFSCGCFYYKLL